MKEQWIQKIIPGCLLAAAFGLGAGLSQAKSTPVAKPKTSHYAMSSVGPKGTWSLLASMGYSNWQKMYHDDGQFALGRLAVARSIFQVQNSQIGLELGVQNGTSSRLNLTQTQMDFLGGLPVNVALKPSLDLLATLKTAALFKQVFAEVKAGATFRRMQFIDRNSVNDLNRANPELQAGLGYPITPTSNLSLLYQGIYGGNLRFVGDAASGTARVSGIPSQHSVLLSLTIALN